MNYKKKYIPQISSHNIEFANIIRNNCDDSNQRFINEFKNNNMKDNSEMLLCSVLFNNSFISDFLLKSKNTDISFSGLEAICIALVNNNFDFLQKIINNKEIINYQKRNFNEVFFEAFSFVKDVKILDLILKSEFIFSEKNINFLFYVLINNNNKTLLSHLIKMFPDFFNTADISKSLVNVKNDMLVLFFEKKNTFNKIEGNILSHYYNTNQPKNFSTAIKHSLFNEKPDFLNKNDMMMGGKYDMTNAFFKHIISTGEYQEKFLEEVSVESFKKNIQDLYLQTKIKEF
jgi:hypothetical protein